MKLMVNGTEVQVITPKEIAVELGIDPKKVRRILRSKFGKVGLGSRWLLTPDQVRLVHGALVEKAQAQMARIQQLILSQKANQA